MVGFLLEVQEPVQRLHRDVRGNAQERWSRRPLLLALLQRLRCQARLTYDRDRTFAVRLFLPKICLRLAWSAFRAVQIPVEVSRPRRRRPRPVRRSCPSPYSSLRLSILLSRRTPQTPGHAQHLSLRMRLPLLNRLQEQGMVSVCVATVLLALQVTQAVAVHLLHL